MGPRTILYTGAGGAGKTSVAAATARRLASRGRRTLVLSAAPGGGLADVLALELGDGPNAIGENLWAQQVSARDELERQWGAAQGWLGDLLARRGIDRITAAELSVPPGADELFSLLELRRCHASGEYDAIVVDCAAGAETLRLLAFPEAARWWLEKALPQRSAQIAAARPFAKALPDEAVLGDVQRLLRHLIAMNELLRDHERVSVRLVATPDAVALDETRRTFTALALHGFLTDAVVLNRALPAEAGPYFEHWRARQAERLEEAIGAFAPVPVLRAPLLPEEVAGAAALDRLAHEVFADGDPGALMHRGVAQEVVLGAREAELRLGLPFAHKAGIDVKHSGLDLIVRVDGHRRTIALPPALADYRPAGARFEDGMLRVLFDREPAAATATADD